MGRHRGALAEGSACAASAAPRRGNTCWRADPQEAASGVRHASLIEDEPRWRRNPPPRGLRRKLEPITVCGPGGLRVSAERPRTAPRRAGNVRPDPRTTPPLSDCPVRARLYAVDSSACGGAPHERLRTPAKSRTSAPCGQTGLRQPPAMHRAACGRPVPTGRARPSRGSARDEVREGDCRGGMMPSTQEATALAITIPPGKFVDRGRGPAELPR